MVENNVTRLLDSRNVDFVAHELPDEKLGAINVAKALDVPLEQVFKTIVVKRLNKGKTILAMVPGNKEVNLKLMAQALNEKKVVLASHREAEQITGLKVGGISPLALINRGFQVIIDLSAKNFERIYISGGERRLNINIRVPDLIDITNASTAIIS